MAILGVRQSTTKRSRKLSALGAQGAARLSWYQHVRTPNWIKYRFIEARRALSATQAALAEQIPELGKATMSIVRPITDFPFRIQGKHHVGYLRAYGHPEFQMILEELQARLPDYHIRLGPTINVIELEPPGFEVMD